MHLTEVAVVHMQVKADVLPYCKMSDTIGAFKLPAIDYLKSARVVVATCGAAGMLREGSYETKDLRFTHVLIDEAGQVQSPSSPSLGKLPSLGKSHCWAHNLMVGP